MGLSFGEAFAKASADVDSQDFDAGFAAAPPARPHPQPLATTLDEPDQPTYEDEPASLEERTLEPDVDAAQAPSKSLPAAATGLPGTGDPDIGAVDPTQDQPEPEPERDAPGRPDEPAADTTDTAVRPGKPKGGSGGGSAPAVTGPGPAAVPAATQATSSAAAPEPAPSPDRSDPSPPTDQPAAATDVSDQQHQTFAEISTRRKTDHRDAVQAATSVRTRGGSGGGSSPLPQAAMRVLGAKSQPVIRSMPDVIIDRLREMLRAAAVRELSVSDDDARAFSDSLSQASLVLALLVAQLDVGLTVDPATEMAASLLRRSNPLLGSVVSRLTALEDREAGRDALLADATKKLHAVGVTGEVIEQLVAYQVADRGENFLRGNHVVEDAPITHRSALVVRDRARDLTRKQRKLEIEQDWRLR